MTAGARAPLRTVLCALYQCAERRRVNDSGGCVPLRAQVEDGALKPSVVPGFSRGVQDTYALCLGPTDSDGVWFQSRRPRYICRTSGWSSRVSGFGRGV